MADVAYNGADITDESAMVSCVHEMHAWGALESLTVVFDDDDGSWRSWHPAVGDTVEVSDGAATTGAMRVVAATYGASTFKVRALAAPAGMLEERRRSWESVRLSQLIAQVAAECGLAAEMHGVDDRLYGRVDQAGIDDARFLAARLDLEGACMAVHGGTLAVYGARWAEEREPALPLTVAHGQLCELRSRARVPYGACRVVSGTVEGIYRASDGPTLTCRPGIAVTDSGEAVRFARNLLRKSRREERIAIVHADEVLQAMAPGVSIDLEADGMDEWSGRAVVAHLRHDYVAEKSKAWLAMALGGL